MKHSNNSPRPNTHAKKAGGLRATLIAAALTMYGSAGASPPRAEIIIEGSRTFPENITSTGDGVLITGSVGSGGIFRAAAGASIMSQWIAPGDNGLLDTFGVLADEASGTLWVCSSHMDMPNSGNPPAVPALYRYDLESGRFRSKHPLPGGAGLCNDIAIGPDRAAYVADTTGGRILRLPFGGEQLQEWSTSKDLAGADGLDFQGQHLYVNSYTTGKLLRINLQPDGSAGRPTTLRTTRPLTRPDGMRRLSATQFVLAEGAGNISLLTVQGDVVHVEVLQAGLIDPAGVTVVGDTVWAVESKLSLRNVAGARPAPFIARAIYLPQRRQR
ncbi:SMP-30/gluconolactonase/LRE family protein [Aquincola tertiaricarbonis]|uniref:SMP-30/gluconolactonase/LRE family protein n=1 Tax=Aquincola tertiaricarbonis TaxID=391953 RepID=UPI0012EE8542|nr:hypothetical protein [Aquincola tertiaricarbonis]